MSEAEPPARSHRPALTVICGRADGGAPPARIALSLVHARERIDIPVSAVVRIEAREEFTVCDWGTRRLWTFPSPHVEVCFTPAIHARIYRLTRQIVDEPVEIIVGSECVYRPIVREPLRGQGFRISAFDLAEAHALAHRLRAGWSKAVPRLVS
jgi:hypothetical protein